MAFGIDDAVNVVGNVVGKIIDRIWPDPTVNAQMKTDLAKQMADNSLKEYLADTDLVKGQIDVDKIEASNPNTFVAGWRPFIGWIGGMALANHFIIAPYFDWVAALFHSTAAVPDPQIMDLLALIGGMLGFGSMRTIEKLAGKAGGMQ